MKNTLSEISKTLSIAIIDDCPLFMSKLSQFLEPLEYSILAISEAMSGMGKLMDQKPLLILLDTKMPTVDGYSVCKFIRSTSCLKDVPIILLSDFDHKSERDQARFFGATDVFCKHIGLDQLIPLINQYIA